VETKGLDSGLNTVKDGSMGRRCEAMVNQASLLLCSHYVHRRKRDPYVSTGKRIMLGSVSFYTIYRAFVVIIRW